MFFYSPFPFSSCSLRFFSGEWGGEEEGRWRAFVRLETPKYLEVADGEVLPIVVTVKRKKESGERGNKGRKAHTANTAPHLPSCLSKL
jgi:hypothetical protein